MSDRALRYPLRWRLPAGAASTFWLPPIAGHRATRGAAVCGRHPRGLARIPPRTMPRYRRYDSASRTMLSAFMASAILPHASKRVVGDARWKAAPLAVRDGQFDRLSRPANLRQQSLARLLCSAASCVPGRLKACRGSRHGGRVENRCMRFRPPGMRGWTRLP